ncbi:MAG: hypothetical protein HQM16_01315 [Deltaproteobacteria bacterium]|nr:hypothetical protein [Deltaproteobacteria bacterium]
MSHAQHTDQEIEKKLAQEMAAIPYEPLLPIEKKLIAWSLVIGVSLLLVLMWVV